MAYGVAANAQNYFRFGGIADMAGLATGSTRSRMTRCGSRPRGMVRLVVSNSGDVVQRGSSLLLRTCNFRAEPTCSTLLRYTHNEVALYG